MFCVMWFVACCTVYSIQVLVLDSQQLGLTRIHTPSNISVHVVQVKRALTTFIDQRWCALVSSHGCCSPSWVLLAATALEQQSMQPGLERKLQLSAMLTVQQALSWRSVRDSC
jgi:hypothetical protein